MLKIRLQKVGKKNSPSYRVVLCEHTAPPQGKFIEILGFYNARLKKKGFKKDRIEYWLSKGAQLSSTVHNLLVDEGVLKGIKLKAWRPKKRAKAKSAEVPQQRDEGGKEELKAEVSEGEAKNGKPATVPKTAPQTGQAPSQKDEEIVKEETKEEKKEQTIDKQEKID